MLFSKIIYHADYVHSMKNLPFFAMDLPSLPVTQSNLILALLYHINTYVFVLYVSMSILYGIDKLCNFNYRSDIQRHLLIPIYSESLDQYVVSCDHYFMRSLFSLL